MTKIVLAPLSKDIARKAADQTVKAVLTCEKSKRVLLAAVAQAVAVINMPLSAAQYDRQFRPYLADNFAKAVVRNQISKATAAQYSSKLKTAVLAILSAKVEPLAGETFWEFYDRAAEAVANAKLPDGSPVWEATAKRGRKQGVKLPAKKGGAVPGAVAQANAEGSAADTGETGFNRSPQIAAALILCKGNEARAQRLVLVLGNYVEEFDRWCSTILSADDMAKAGAEAAKARIDAAKVATVTPEPQEPETALGAALIDAQRKSNQKTRKAA